MSTPIKTQADFRQLADIRLAEAKVLLDQGLWDGAYYLTGYAVELALKACIIKALMATDAFPERKYSESCYTHKLGDLVSVAGLRADLDTATTADPVLLSNWGTANVWSEQKRYHRITEAEARELHTAVTDTAHGVLPWIKTHW